MKVDSNGFPRRNVINFLTEEEKKVLEAIEAIEQLPYADEKLTEASMLIQKAKDLLADYLEENELV